jgi:hypothetical protein
MECLKSSKRKGLEIRGSSNIDTKLESDRTGRKNQEDINIIHRSIIEKSTIR